MIGQNRFPVFQFRQAIRPIMRTVRLVGVTPDDTLIASFPRSGSTWLRFLLADILLGRDPDWGSMERAVPIVGAHRGAPPVGTGPGRLIKTHDLATGRVRRAVYLARDGRDVTLANYRWFVRGGYDGTLEDFVPRFVAGKMNVFGSWAGHVTYWLDSSVARNGALHVVRYEDLREDTAAALGGVVRFLGIPTSDEAIARAVEDNGLARMREKEEAGLRSTAEGASTERFVGQGSVGGWAEKLSEQQIASIESAGREALRRLGYPMAASATS
jgi:hypothetical protein